MSDITVSRKRIRRAIDPCLGFYVSSTQAYNDEENLSGLRSGFAPVGMHRNTVKHALQPVYQAAESPSDPMTLLAVAGVNILEPPIGDDFVSTSQCGVSTSLGDPPLTPQSGQHPHHSLNTSRSLLNGEMPQVTVEKFLRLSAAATKNDRAFKISRYFSKRKRRYRVSGSPVPRAKPFTSIMDICDSETKVSVEEGLTPLMTSTECLDAHCMDSIQLRSRKVRRTMPKPGLYQDSQMEKMDSDSDTSRQGSNDESVWDMKRPAKGKRRAATKKKLNERLFDALVLTHGHPDKTLISADPHHLDGPHRSPLQFVPQDSVVDDRRKTTAWTLVNPRRSLAIRSATLAIPMRRDGTGTQMGSVLNRWPVNVVQQNKATEDRQRYQPDQRQAQRAHHPLQNRSTTSSFDSQSNDRKPLTFTNAVCAERSYTRMFSSTVYVTSQPNCGQPFNSIRRSRGGPSKPKPEKSLSSRGVIDQASIKNGAVLLKRLSSVQDSNCQEVINAAGSIDGPATLRMHPPNADLVNARNSIKENSDVADFHRQQSVWFHPAPNNAVLSILSENSSSGTGAHNDQPPQTAKNTLQHGTRSDNLNICGRETSEVIGTSLNKPHNPLVSFMEYCRQEMPILPGSVAKIQDIDSHDQPQCKELAITRHRLAHIRGARARPAGPSIELSPISGFSKASIEGYEQSILDEIKNEYPRMRSTFRFEVEES